MRIPLVRMDRRPYVTLSLTSDADGRAIDLTDATVTLSARRAGSTEIAFTVPIEVVEPTNGICRFCFPEATLSVPAGSYQGELVVVFSNGDPQTVFDFLHFQVRERLAPVPQTLN